MLLDIRRIFSGADRETERKIKFDFSKESCDGYQILSPTVFTVKIKANEDSINLLIESDVHLKTECARCLKPIEPLVHVNRDIMIYRDGSHAEEEDLPYVGIGRLNLYELCFTEIVLAVPSVLLCSENCEGICPICGKERSLGCSCVTQEIDDRLAILSQLLTD